MRAEPFVVSKFVKEGKLPHLLFYGPPGTGKTSTAVALAHTLYGKDYHSSLVLELNASDERGIDVVREQIKSFAATKTFASGPQTGLASAVKLIILDEADAMTSAAQNALRRVMEKFVRNIRFIIICNYVGQIIPPLQSRCTRFRFAPLPLPALQERLDFVAREEKLAVSEEASQALIRIANGDMRRVLNVLQAAAAAFNGSIDANAIYAVTAAPHPKDMDNILHWLLNEDISESYSRIERVQKEQSLALCDIIRELFERISVQSIQLPPSLRVFLISKLADIEHKLAVGASEAMQLAALTGAFQIARSLPEMMK